MQSSAPAATRPRAPVYLCPPVAAPLEPLSPPSPQTPQWMPSAMLQRRPSPALPAGAEGGSAPGLHFAVQSALAPPSLAASVASASALPRSTEAATAATALRARGASALLPAPPAAAPLPGAAEARLGRALACMLLRRLGSAPDAERAAAIVRPVTSAVLEVCRLAEARDMPLAESSLERVLASFLARLAPAWPPKAAPPPLSDAARAAVASLVRQLPQMSSAQVRAIFAAIGRGLGLARAPATAAQARYLEQLSDELVHCAMGLLGEMGALPPELPPGEALARARRCIHALVGLRDGACPSPGADTGVVLRAKAAPARRVDWLSRLLRPACGLAARRQAFSHEEVCLPFLVGAALGVGLTQGDWDRAARLPPVGVPRWTLHPDDLPAMVEACERAREAQACVSLDAPYRDWRVFMLDFPDLWLLDQVPGFAWPLAEPSDDPSVIGPPP